MYVVKGQEMHRSDIKKAVEHKLREMMDQEYYSKKEKELFYVALNNEADLKDFANTLWEINHALLKGSDVFAVCDKAPSSLDRGSHHYSIYYTKAGKVHRVWIGRLAFKKMTGMGKESWTSGVIGMSRVLDATDGLFSYLKSITGTYAQINCL